MEKDLESYEVATFAGGCFWCMEAAFERSDGVAEVISGYTGGRKDNPSYEEVSSGTTGHYEAIQVYYDPDKISYEDLLGLFWRNIDPTDGGGQFVDRGSQYKTAIFYHNENQKELAEKSREELEKSGKFDKPIATAILPFTVFYKARALHAGGELLHAGEGPELGTDLDGIRIDLASQHRVERLEEALGLGDRLTLYHGRHDRC